MVAVATEGQRLADICGRLFLFLTTFRRNAKTSQIDPEWLRRSLIAIFDEQESLAARDLDLKRLYERAKYPLVALADEVALNTEWSGREKWEEDLLEQHFFGTAVAGEEFYVRLKEVAPDQDQLAEIYFLCLSLGFKGRYRSRPEERREMQQRLYRSLPGRLASKNEPLTPGAADATLERNMSKLPLVSTLRLVVMLCAAISLAFIAGRVIAEHELGKLKDQIHAVTEFVEKKGN